MQGSRSPDRPATFLKRWLGAHDTEPPITDQEYDLYCRFRDGLRFAPKSVIDTFPPCPSGVSGKTRPTIRQIVSDPRLPKVLDLMEAARQEVAHREAQLAAERKDAEAAAAADAFRTKLQAIDAFHDDQLHEVSFRFKEFEHLLGKRTVAEASLRMTLDSQSELTKTKRALNVNFASQGEGSGALLLGVLAGVENNMRDKSAARKIAEKVSRVRITRSLVAMSENERATLRMADVLAALRIISDEERMQIAVPIVWNDGECAIEFGSEPEFRERAAILDTLKPLVASGLSTSAGARERLNQAVRAAIAPNGKATAAQRDVIERYLYSGNHWMSEAEAARALVSDRTSPTALRLGQLANSGGELLYDLRESLITVAPPGSGKSQAHVMRNLLHLNAPAVVLDVKGEMLRDTQAWREQSVGRTYVFDPKSPNDSIHYNPLDDIRTDPELAWDDARRLADLLVIPSGKDDYFESRARDMITTALLDLALSTDEERTMAGVLDRLYTSTDEDIIKWCDQLEEHGNTQLARQASALRGMPPKQREGVFDSARRQLEIWQSPAIAKISSVTTFDPGILREQNGTLYLAVALEDIKKYSSVLRVLIGQTLAKLYRQRPEASEKTITFFLDELPRLGRMDVIEESLDVGRGFGVRLWMFCQNYGQLKAAYPNAQGMMSNCAVRCFMNPDEDSARWIAENLGMKQGLLDGDRKPLVEAHQLTGPEFADKVIVFARGVPPSRLNKVYAFSDPLCRVRIAANERQDTPPTPSIVPEQASSPEKEADEPGIAPETGSDAIDWDSIGPAPVPVTPPPAEAAPPEPLPEKAASPIAPARAVTPLIGPPSPSRKRLAIAGLLLFLAAAGASTWANTEFSKLRKENQSLAAALEATKGEKLAFEGQSAEWQQKLREAEKERDQAKSNAAFAYSMLALERRDHENTRSRLASAKHELDAANSREASRANNPAPLPAPPVQSAPSPTVAPMPPDTSPRTNTATPRLTDCDLLAANPNDPRRIGDGVKFGELAKHAGEAVAACERALAEAPNDQRLLYQKARALYASNDPQARAIFRELMKLGYPSAFDNAAQYLLKEGRMPEAESLLRQGVMLHDPDAMVTLADYIRAGRMTPRNNGEDMTLYQMAADAGHQGAKKAIDEQRATNEFISRTATDLLRNLAR